MYLLFDFIRERALGFVGLWCGICRSWPWCASEGGQSELFERVDKAVFGEDGVDDVA